MIYKILAFSFILCILIIIIKSIIIYRKNYTIHYLIDTNNDLWIHKISKEKPSDRLTIKSFCYEITIRYTVKKEGRVFYMTPIHIEKISYRK